METAACNRCTLNTVNDRIAQKKKKKTFIIPKGVSIICHIPKIASLSADSFQVNAQRFLTIACIVHYPQMLRSLYYKDPFPFIMFIYKKLIILRLFQFDNTVYALVLEAKIYTKRLIKHQKTVKKG